MVLTKFKLIMGPGIDMIQQSKQLNHKYDFRILRFIIDEKYEIKFHESF